MSRLVVSIAESGREQACRDDLNMDTTAPAVRAPTKENSATAAARWSTLRLYVKPLCFHSAKNDAGDVKRVAKTRACKTFRGPCKANHRIANILQANLNRS